MKAIDAATKRADKLLNEARDEYKKVSDTISEYSAKLDQATEDMEKFASTCDLDGYTRAREEKARAEGAIEMYQKRAAELETKPLMPEEEYTKLCDSVIDEYREYMASLKEKLYDLTSQLEALANDARRYIGETNSTLHTLQYDIYRGHDLEYEGNGKIILRQTEKKADSQEDWSLIEWASRAGQGQIYKDMKKARDL